MYVQFIRKCCKRTKTNVGSLQRFFVIINVFRFSQLNCCTLKRFSWKETQIQHLNKAVRLPRFIFACMSRKCFILLKKLVRLEVLLFLCSQFVNNRKEAFVKQHMFIYLFAIVKLKPAVRNICSKAEVKLPGTDILLHY